MAQRLLLCSKNLGTSAAYQIGEPRVVRTYNFTFIDLRCDLFGGKLNELALYDLLAYLLVFVEIGSIDLLLIIANVARWHTKFLANVGAGVELRLMFSGLAVV
jgi:hypothetical protein